MCIACEFHQLWTVRPCIYHIFRHLIKWLIFCRTGHAGTVCVYIYMHTSIPSRTTIWLKLDARSSLFNRAVNTKNKGRYFNLLELLTLPFCSSRFLTLRPWAPSITTCGGLMVWVFLGMSAYKKMLRTHLTTNLDAKRSHQWLCNVIKIHIQWTRRIGRLDSFKWAGRVCIIGW